MGVLSSFIMVIVLIYIFAIVMNIFLKEDEDTHMYFSTLGLCMWTLLLDGVLGDGTGTMLNLLVHRREPNTIVGVISFFIFMILATITVMNMVIGVLCEVVASVTEAEKEEASHNLLKESAVDCLQALGVHVDFLQTLQVKAYEVKDTTVSIPDLLEQMLMCREEQPATMKHLILQQEIGAWITSNKLHQFEKRLNKKLDARFGLLLSEFHSLHNDLLRRLGALRMPAVRTGFVPPPNLFPSAPATRPPSALSFASWI